MRKLTIFVVLVLSLIATGAQAKQSTPVDLSKPYDTSLSGGAIGVLFECIPQVMFEGDASLNYYFYATHPSPGNFSLILDGKLQSGKSLSDLGEVTANIKQDGASTINEVVTCVAISTGFIRCTKQYSSDNIPTKVRLRSELGCGYSPYVDLGYGYAGDEDGDGVASASDECLSTPFGTDVGSDGCEIEPPDTTPDADGDGVVDADDDCPDTETGATVDANGCSDAQLAVLEPDDDDTDDDDTDDDAPGADPDGDGIPNSADECDYEAGSIDDYGCPPEADADPAAASPSDAVTVDDGGSCSLIAR